LIASTLERPISFVFSFIFSFISGEILVQRDLFQTRSGQAMKHLFLLTVTSVVLVAGLLDGAQHQNLDSFYN
jgi:hypothetical protein